MTTLNNITQVKIKKMRVGRGIGSGKGKTSGRCVKGQNMEKYEDKTVNECKQLCSSNVTWEAFEYGVHYGVDSDFI